MAPCMPRQVSGPACAVRSCQLLAMLRLRPAVPLLTQLSPAAQNSGLVATVFGCSGFLARYVVNSLARQGSQVPAAPGLPALASAAAPVVHERSRVLFQHSAKRSLGSPAVQSALSAAGLACGYSVP